MILQAGLELLPQHIIVEIRQQLHVAIHRQIAIVVHLQTPLILRVVRPPAPVILRVVHLHHPLGRVVILVVAEVAPAPVHLVEAAGEDNRVRYIKKIYV